jgi:nitrite reductase (NO-forming)
VRKRTVLILLAATAVLGFGAFALAGGLDRTVSERVEGGGTQVVRVALVDAVVGFDVTPDRLEVDSGTRLVLDVVNEGGDPHDLAAEGGPKTAVLDPGQSERLDLGTVRTSLPELYCTLPGHRSAGMTLDVEVRRA